MIRRGGLLGTVARTAVVAGTANAVVGGMNRRRDARDQQAAESDAYQAQQQQAAMQAQAQQYAQQAPPASTGAPQDLTSKIKQLADLKAAGALTDEEFAAAKAKLLA